MARFRQFVVDFLRREDGPTAVEYAVTLALIIAVCATSIAAFGNTTNGLFQKSANATTTGS
jgi:pilus assembly protein Flp/PilA